METGNLDSCLLGVLHCVSVVTLDIYRPLPPQCHYESETRNITEFYTYGHTNVMKNETKKKIVKLSCLLGVLHHVIIVTLDG